jgi:regulatory protein
LSSPQRKSCGQKALDFLSRRSHFERELARKLRQRGYDEAEVAETLERLRAQGLVDDRRTAREFVRGRLARAPEGRRKLRAELVRRGVADDVVTETLDELTDDDDRDLARQAAERWRRTRSRPGRSADLERAALGRHLAARGFSERAIYSLLDEMPRGDSAG